MRTQSTTNFINIQNNKVLNQELLNNKQNNNLLKMKPELWEIWDFKKNNFHDINIYNMTKGSDKKVWWICKKCDSSYDMSINKKVNSRGCPYCAGYRVNHTNSLEVINPELSSQWHPAKNGDLTPSNIVCGNTQKVWWMGDCGHEWQASTHNRSYGTGCPYCVHNPKVLVGFNDLWTTHPHIAKLLVNSEDGHKYTKGANKKVKWKCLDCNHINLCGIPEMCSRDLYCKKCSDSLSLGEKIVYSLLKFKLIEFDHEISFKWSDSKRYDFFIPSLSAIIEVHGEQHYKQSNRGKRTLQQEQDNDSHKKNVALKHGIKHYIIVDARYSDFEWIKKSILNSDIANLFNINSKTFNSINVSYNLLTVEAWKLWNEGYRVMAISERLKINKSAVRRYLKLGKSLNLCNYEVENRYDRARKAILMIDEKGNILREYKGLIEASRKIGASIRPMLFPATKLVRSRGYIWIYKEDYSDNKPFIDEKLNC